MKNINALFCSALLAFGILGIIATTAPRAAYAADDSVFTVQDVHVDITAADAAKARGEAFYKAQADAFQKLIDRLLSKDQAASFQMPEADTISTFVKDYEITEEQLSTVRYIGTYTFRFKGADVRQYLAAQHLTYSDVASKPVLVLPFYQIGGQTLLWDNRNDWLAAWSNSKINQGLVPAVVPIGDLQDVSDISDGQALSYDPQALDDMIGRYQAREAIILIASPQINPANGGIDHPQGLSIAIYSTKGSAPTLLTNLSVTANNGEKTADMFKRAVQSVRQYLQSRWKSRTEIDSAYGENMIRAQVRFATMGQWLETQKALQNVQGLTDTNLIALTPHSATLDVTFQGSMNRLKLAFSQADLTLSNPQPIAGVPQQNGNIGQSRPYGSIADNAYTAGQQQGGAGTGMDTGTGATSAQNANNTGMISTNNSASKYDNGYRSPYTQQTSAASAPQAQQQPQQQPQNAANYSTYGQTYSPENQAVPSGPAQASVMYDLSLDKYVGR